MNKLVSEFKLELKLNEKQRKRKIRKPQMIAFLSSGK